MLLLLGRRFSSLPGCTVHESAACCSFEEVIKANVNGLMNNTMDRVLIRDTDHLAHFTADLSASLTSGSFADVVLRCANNGSGGGGGAKSRKVCYPTLRVHRAVLASMSDFLGELILPHSLEEDIHITLDDTAYDVAKRIVEFAYAGEVRIPKQLVTSVCDAAHRLHVKFLKDSFVKVTDKDYAAMKAGKKTLETIIQKPTSPFKKPTPTTSAAATKKKMVKITAAAKSAKMTTSSKTDSDTDSADSDNEGKNIKVPTGGKVVTSKGSTSKSAKNKAKSETVMFTLTKQVEDDSTSTVSDNGTFLVHFNQKTVAENQENRAPALKPILPLVPPRQVAIPISVASIQQPLPPSALPRVKKVTIPPMMRKSTIALPKKSPATSSTFTIAAAGTAPKAPTAPPKQVISLNTFQVHTIKQPDGTEIQVLKQPSGTIMKQLKGVVRSPPTATGKTAVPSRNPPKDALAIAMEAIAGGSRGGNLVAGIQLPKNPVPMTRVVLPTAPVPVPGIAFPAKPLPASALGSLKKVDLSSLKPIHPSAIGATAKGAIALLQHPPGYAPVNRLSPSKATDTAVSDASTVSRHSVSQPKLGIPSTVPDDFLMTEDSSEGSVNASNATPFTMKGRKAAGPPRARGIAKKTAVLASSRSKPPCKDASAAIAKTTLTKSMLDSSLTRSSGRVRKVNQKYAEKDEEEEDDKSKSSVSSNAAKKPTPEPAAPKGKKPGAANVSKDNSRKRKATLPKEETAEGEEDTAPPPPKKVAIAASSTKNKAASRAQNNKNVTKSAAATGSKSKVNAKPSSKKMATANKSTSAQERSTRTSSAFKVEEKPAVGKRLRTRRDNL